MAIAHPGSLFVADKRRTIRRQQKARPAQGVTAKGPETSLVQDAPNVEQLRNLRAEFYSKTPQERTKTTTKTTSNANSSMPYISESRSLVRSKREGKGSHRSSRHRHHHHHHHHHGGDAQETATRDEAAYVYRTVSPPDDVGHGGAVGAVGAVGASQTTISRSKVSSSTRKSSTPSKPSRRNATSGQTMRVSGEAVEEDLSRTETRSRPRHSEDHPRQQSNPQLPRSTSLREPAAAQARPPLRRSNTTTHARAPTTRPSSVAARDGPRARRQSTGLFAMLFGPTHTSPPKLVECSICLSDDIPISKSARLACGHRMCHGCLKRVFTMSVHDPQHMPPRCCTQDHIPLKHVERLFNDKFKILWNKKYQEYTTKNRIYCPNKGCGEWIKPANIHVEAGGRKCGKCSRCKTKVCCSCNGKWHRSRECPNDEETKRIVEIAKTEGWQRCYNCRAMVELKEGCNHMTCRCTAQFCMICGSKWKSCDCPWFNYNNDVEPNPGDRLNHMNIPRAVNILFRREPPAYQDELDHRRRQELEDEAYARRLQVLGLDGDDDDRRTELLDASYDDTWGVGNTMDHHMNADYVPEGRRALPLPPPAAPDELAHPPLPPPLRRHTSHSRRYNSSPSTRPADRVIPARTSMDYAAEAALHRPFEAVERRRGRRRASLLAGLNSSVPGSGGGRNRVGAWLRYVEFGPPPDERIVGAGLVENGELVREVGVA